MSWRDNLVNASFRGVEFKVEQSISEFGRRIEIHELTGEELPFIEEKGRELDTFNIRGYIIANKDNDYDYFSNRDALIAALKADGVGLLIHPFYGEISVAVNGTARITETFNEGGIARFEMPFVEQKDRLTPSKTSSYKDGVDNSVDNGIDLIKDNFYNNYSSGGVFDSQINSATDVLLTSQITAIYGMNAIQTSYASEAVANISAEIVNIKTFLDSPCDMAESILSSVNQFANLCGFGVTQILGGVLGGCSGVRRGVLTLLDGETIPDKLGISSIIAIIEAYTEDPEGKFCISNEQANNIRLITDMNKSFLLGIAAKIAIRTDFFSQNETFDYMNLIVDAMNELLTRIGDEDGELDTKDLFEAIESIRNEFVKNMIDKASLLKKEIDYQIGSGIISTLELSYNLYNDIDRCSDVFNRNTPIVNHPGFLPGGKKIKVLDE